MNNSGRGHDRTSVIVEANQVVEPKVSTYKVSRSLGARESSSTAEALLHGNKDKQVYILLMKERANHYRCWKLL